MFGTSLSEIAVVGVVALVVVGPQKLPTMLRTLGQWTGKLRRMTMEMRAKTGIDEILREEGIDGVVELRALLRGEVAAARQAFQRPHFDPYQDDAPVDLATEYPSEGVDTMGAIPEDLLVHSRIAQVEASTETARAGSLSTSLDVSQAPTPAETATPENAPSPTDAPAPLDAPSDDAKPHSP